MTSIQRANIASRGAETKEWCAKDCGQGHRTGGTEAHRRFRYEIMFRLKYLSEAYGQELPARMNKRWEAFVEWWDESNRKRLPVAAGIGQFVVDWAFDLRKSMGKDRTAFVTWAKEEMKKMPEVRLKI